MKLTDRIEKYCDENKITHREFAEKVGMPDMAIYRIFRDGRLSYLNHLKDLARFFGITLDELLEDE